MPNRDLNTVLSESMKKVYRTAYKYIRNPQDAEDLTQEAFYRYLVYNRNHKIDFPEEFLLITVKNLAKNHLRDRQHYNERVEKLTSGNPGEMTAPDVEDELFAKMWNREVQEATVRILEAVYEKNRGWYDVVMCIYGMGMSAKKTAQALGLSESSVTSRLQRARKWIMKNYRETYDRVTKA